MPTTRLRPRLAVALLALAAALPAVVGVAARAQDGTESAAVVYQGKTKPAKEFELAFVNLGVVAEVAAKKGDRVEKGQLLAKQDTRSDEARLREAREEADISDRVELAVQRADLAAVQEERQQKLLDIGGGNPLELEEARLNRLTAQTQIKEERRQGRVAEARVAQIEALIDEKTMTAPAAGIVRRVESQVGEVASPQQPALLLVQIDPLEIDVFNVSVADAASLRAGDPVQVRYGTGDWVDAEISFVDPVAIESTQDRGVVITLPNPEGRPAGLDVDVRFVN
jgi:HlyD family secretion protein